MSKIFSRQFAPFWLLLIAALSLVGAFGNLSFQSRISNLGFSNAGLKNAYIMTSKSEKNVCALVDRRDATVRRSMSKIPGENWSLSIAPGVKGVNRPRGLLLTSRKKGTILFVPVDDVTNLTYPYISEFVRKKNKNIDIPKLEWTQVFFNRNYNGLYLKIQFPSDPTGKKGRKGLRREFLSVRGGELTLVDSAFNPYGRLLAETQLSGVFPKPEPPAPDVSWLNYYSGTGRTAFILYNPETAKSRMTLMPLPVTIDDVYYNHHQAVLPPFLDERYGGWVRQVAPKSPEAPFTDSEKKELRDGFGDYKKYFEKALAIERTAFRDKLAATPERPLALPFGGK